MGEDGAPISFIAFRQKYDIRCNFMEYYTISVITAIPRQWNIALNSNDVPGIRNERAYVEVVDTLIQTEKPSKMIYQKLAKRFAQFPFPFLKNGH